MRLPYPNLIFLNDDQVHLWKISLHDIKNADNYYVLLSDTEKKRANTFRFAKDYNQYVLSRFAVRNILAFYVNMEPNKIKIGYTQYKKPYLLDCSSNIHFNISHSSEIAVCGITKNNLIGVDIEAIEALKDINLIAKSILSKCEYVKFLTISEEARLKTFYSIWTRKESFVKALGKGLFYPLKNCEVSFLPNEFPQIISIESSHETAKNWHLTSFSFKYKRKDYIGSLIIKGVKKHVYNFSYTF